ncbi:type VI secretion system protein TssA [Chelativorans sp. AA-79]|uniref:type VI secretion system protein TssA n=1 Tax=Chelativorans sp. AA-79 TaxID=3028735 RepID=UPI0023FA41B3|nr:type VI secretion system protein TssA [Chelativorans sp. AA-79]WEX08236.1 type VI secretion system protein TssA [Chelativorans sp. AA-79]
MFLEYSKIVSPIDGDRPCGDDIRTNPSHRELYYRIKDARNTARGVERNAAPGDPLSLAQEWREVNSLGTRILTSISKDIEILAWIAEAQIRLNGYSGLRDAFSASTALFDKYWDEIHSVSCDSVEEKIAPLAGLNGINGEGTLVPAIRLASLVPGTGFARHALWDYQLAQRAGEEERRERLQAAVKDAGSAAMASHLADVTKCVEAFDALAAVLDACCGEHAPPSANTRNTLLESAAAIRILAGLSDEVPQTPGHPDGGNHIAAGGQVAATAFGGVRVATVESREDAFETLLAVAHYFRRTEPHSPISMSIETLVRRGRMDFSELLADLLPDPQARKAILTAAGIQPTGSELGT